MKYLILRPLKAIDQLAKARSKATRGRPSPYGFARILKAASPDGRLAASDYRAIQDFATGKLEWRKNLTSAGTNCTKSELIQMRAACPPSMRGRAHTAAWSRGAEGKNAHQGC
jgi:hypothetical protein